MSLRDNLRWSKLHLITDLGIGRGLSADAAPALVGELFDAGVDLIEVRDATLADHGALLDTLAELAFERRRLVVIGRDADLAARRQADLLHLGASDGPLDQARRRLHEYSLIGRSVHTQAQLDHVEDEADYAYVGPVFGARSTGSAPGLELVQRAAQTLADGIVWAAVGGITTGNLDQVLDAGARRVVVSSAIVGQPDPVAAADELATRLRDRFGLGGGLAGGS